MQEPTVAWDHARVQFPDVSVPFSEYAAYLERNAPSPASLSIAADLYLACACSRGDAHAISTFEQRYVGVVESLRLRFGRRAPSSAELWSEIRKQLFVPRERRPPKIEEYSGRSELGPWLRVVVSRLLLNALDAEKPEIAVEERVFEALLVTHATPERAVANAERRAVFVAAFGRAIGELSVRERRLLRLAFAERFTIDDLGQLFGVHRATAARWVKDAVETLGKSVRQIVQAELGLSSSAYESWARDLGSSMAESVGRYLGPG
jgi:RNA polymerase sigma-70 factor, ECF subfamily